MAVLVLAEHDNVGIRARTNMTLKAKPQRLDRIGGRECERTSFAHVDSRHPGLSRA